MFELAFVGRGVGENEKYECSHTLPQQRGQFGVGDTVLVMSLSMFSRSEALNRLRAFNKALTISQLLENSVRYLVRVSAQCSIERDIRAPKPRLGNRGAEVIRVAEQPVRTPNG